MLQILLDPYGFNPLPHAEGDIIQDFREEFAEYVSIHSLTQRETKITIKHINSNICFNPLPHAEGDVCPASHQTSGRMFQSTPSRRGRQAMAFGIA